MNDELQSLEQYLRIPSDAPAPKLVIMGKDPFPGSRTYLPFCKPNWEEQFKANCSGGVVLRALGICRSHQMVSACQTPDELLMELRKRGIWVLNASYTPLAGTPIKKSTAASMLTASLAKHQHILDGAKAVIYCGEAKKVKWVFARPGGRHHDVVHPDVRNKISPHRGVKDEWYGWWSPNALLTRFSLEL